jgi:hypothetical protein
MAQPAAKLSVSVPGELAAAVRKRVGARGLSGFVAGDFLRPSVDFAGQLFGLNLPRRRRAR